MKYSRFASMLPVSLKLPLCAIAAIVCCSNAFATSPNVVISQAYGGGGNSGSVYKNDFIELFNRSSSPVDLTGWSVQYASTAGTTWTVTALSGTIPAYGYYLVQEAAGTGGTTSLPTPDATGNIAMASGGFKVALCNFATALSGSSPVGTTGVIDFLGSGAANAYEGTAAAPAPSNTTADLRGNGGCTDTDNNASDFTAVAPTPRNKTSPGNNCGGGLTGFLQVETKADGTGVIVPSQSLTSGNSITVYAISRDGNSNFLGNVAADSWSITKTGSVAPTDLVPAVDLKSAVFTGHGAGTAILIANSTTANSVSSGTITVTAGAATQVRVETAADGSGTVVPAQTVVSGHAVTMYAIRRDTYANFIDNAAASSWSLSSQSGAVAGSDLSASADLKSATFTGNGQGTATVHATLGVLTSTDSGLLTVTSLPPANVVISQLYGGGGNSSATYTNDYVELFNRTGSAVNITGWSIQYGSSSGAFNNVVGFTNGTVTIPAYSYYLIKLGGGTNAVTSGVADYSADLTNTTAINLGASGGKVLLANTTTALGTITWPDSRVVDLVGYGSGATVFEGAGIAPAPSDNAHALLRNNNGCSDTDNNNTDFATGTPNPRNSSISSGPCPLNPPTITGVANQAVDSAATVGPLNFDVTDVETAASNLVVTATSSNPTLLPNNQISLGGNGIVRTVTLNPVSGQTGTAQITLTVTDSDNMTATTNFYLFVGAGPQVGLIFSENFDEYSDGTQLSQSFSSPWLHSSGTNGELIVSNQAAQVNLYLTNSEDLYASFPSGAVTASSGTILYLGFTIDQTALPGVNGDYFIHLRDATGTFFGPKVFVSTGNAATGKYRIGLSNRANNPPNVQFPLDLSLNTTNRVVVRYKVGTASSTLWVNPNSSTDPSVTATDATSPADITAIGLREPGSPTTPGTCGSQVIDSILISTSFTDVTTVKPTLTAAIVGNALTITWPTNNSSGFVLQSASTVNATTWNPVAGVTTSGSNYTVTVPVTQTPAFFRLKK